MADGKQIDKKNPGQIYPLGVNSIPPARPPPLVPSPPKKRFQLTTRPSTHKSIEDIFCLSHNIKMRNTLEMQGVGDIETGNE